MLDFSPEKMIFIFLIVMLVLGPEKLPELSRKAGKAMAELKKMSGGFREEMAKAMNEVTSDATPSDRPSQGGGESSSPPAVNGTDDPSGS